MSPPDHAWLCRQIVDGTADAIIFADPDGVIQLWNLGAERMFGYSSEDALGRTLDLIIPERLRERHWTGYRQVMASGVTRYGTELPAVRKDGTSLSIEFTVILVADPAGEPLGCAAVIREVTVRWRQQKALKEKLAALESRADRSRS